MISVCIATYNGVNYIEEQLRSILSQLSEEDEVVLSDDGSTDGTLEVIRQFVDPRIRILPSRRFASPILNFEYTLSHAKGDIIFLADQDDIWMPDKVKRTLPSLERYDCVTSDCVVVDGDDRVIDKSFFNLNNTHRGKYYNLLVKNGYLGCCMAFRRCILDKALPFPADVPMHDIWLGNVSAFFYSTTFLDEPLIRFRRHDHNASPTAKKSSFSLCRRLQFRYNVLRGLINRKSK